ncbi:hypothetical protein [Nocardioides sp. LML1-1-1.1]|uniref:hypothetical protein n=1 Tax=Nocardioides sp. LML1-1-1.1 TaxID=3135248 RepID=UPI003448B4DE
MTEPTDPPLDPAREEAVRRALAEAGGPEQVPPPVVSRLDETLAGLVAERARLSHPEDTGVVVPLDAAARRRRLRVRVLLGAAAAVVAVALGAGYLSDDRGDDLTASTADEAPARSTEPSDGAGSVQDKAESLASAADSPAPGSPPGDAVLRRIDSDQPVRDVRPERLRTDLVALQRATLPHPAAADYTTATLTAPADFLCQPADFGTGYLVAVRYDGQPAVVAFRQPVGASQAAEVLTCGTGDVLHSLTLPAAG